MATVEGTARFVERVLASGRLHPSNARRLGPFACTALGFGAYRLVPEGSATGAATAATASGALTRALDSVNVIDTSSHYAFGHSERVIGATLHGRPRDELIVCTKVGHVPRGEMPKGAVPIGAHRGAGTTSDDWHCISPTFVDSEVKACTERLGTKPDFVFLHNPEYLLSARMQEKVPIADAWDEMYQSLFEAFKILERLCNDGIITSGYGVSSNFLSCMFSVTGLPNLYESLVLDRVVDAAASAARAEGLQKHRFQVAQLPLNAFENGAVLGRTPGTQAEGDCSMAQRLGVSILTNRPINALPMPGVSTGDWGRGGNSYLQLREAKPMGTTQSLLKRVVLDALADAKAKAEAEATLQQVALRLASSSNVSCTLNGAHQTKYVEDLEDVLKVASLSESQVQRAMQSVRSMATELGCQTKGLW
ncbi:unnamed protein product [Cladocopium goreaui]|uniref:Acetylornithine aminotransferase, mitochondrial n=1 Tax=Cladocopium goreaui TaxID=2562237 RepID=A0A9P1FHJ8_9DINO|nr:unnamed protein product [Cladocopium goreaui]